MYRANNTWHVLRLGICLRWPQLPMCPCLLNQKMKTCSTLVERKVLQRFRSRHQLSLAKSSARWQSSEDRRHGQQSLKSSKNTLRCRKRNVSQRRSFKELKKHWDCSWCAQARVPWPRQQSLQRKTKQEVLKTKPKAEKEVESKEEKKLEEQNEEELDPRFSHSSSVALRNLQIKYRSCQAS